MRASGILFVFAALLCASLPMRFALFSASAGEPFADAQPAPNTDDRPRNPYLADSTWPMTHASPYNQASTNAPGPCRATEAIPSFLPGEAVPITVAISSPYPDGSRVAWSTTLEHVFKVDVSASPIRYLDKVARQFNSQSELSSAYSLVDRDGVFFTLHGAAIDAYTDSVAGDPQSPIELKSRYEIPRRFCEERDQCVVGINLTYDGRIVFVTRSGLVGCLARELDDAEYLQLDMANETITNSIAVDETGGIFVVSSAQTYRVNWVPDADQRLMLAWSCPYSTAHVRARGRLGTGSGTTPTLVGSGDDDKFVAICDGQRLMHMVLFWRAEIPEDWEGLAGKDRRIAAEVPVTFGKADAKFSTTEQSITAHGSELVTVSNLYGPIGPVVKRIYRRLGVHVHHATIHQSNRASIAPYGVEKFTWNPETRELVSTWANPTASCPNGIPSMSAATGLLYFMGQRDSQWTLEALDWKTGEPVFHQLLSRQSQNNSFYAGAEIGPSGMVLSGTYGGLLRFSESGDSPSLAGSP